MDSDSRNPDAWPGAFDLESQPIAPKRYTTTQARAAAAKERRMLPSLNAVLWTVFVLAIYSAFLFVALMAPNKEGMLPAPIVAAIWMCVLAFAIAVYFLPWIVAAYVNHPSATGVGALNMFFGWTFLGWVIALVWACSVREGGNCWQCNGRLNGYPPVCQFCQAPIAWNGRQSYRRR